MTLHLYELCGTEAARTFSPYCWRAGFALAHKGLPFTSVPWRFTEKAAIAAHGSTTVPVLLHDGRPVIDSWVIAGYLEAHWPERPTLFPGGIAATRFVKAWSEAMLAHIAPIVLLAIHDHLDPVDQAYFRESREKRFGRTLEEISADPAPHVERLRGYLGPLRTVLRQQSFVDGDSPAHGDHCCMAPFMWARAVSDVPLLAPDDPVHAWRERMLDAYDGFARRAPGYD
ncbi:MAG: glutathione S-transferase N-terminal domain-containing protein [Pseudomonadota bacterium]|nr:glutathione S-transferase N-terminal domain-containing protein [Pseudomonadota bacterium]